MWGMDRGLIRRKSVMVLKVAHQSGTEMLLDEGVCRQDEAALIGSLRIKSMDLIAKNEEAVTCFDVMGFEIHFVIHLTFFK